MWNSTKIKREQRRLDDMVTNVGMPPSWEAIGRDKKVSIIHDEIVFETLAEYPTLEAAVMWAELAGDIDRVEDMISMAILRKAVNLLKGR